MPKKINYRLTIIQERQAESIMNIVCNVVRVTKDEIIGTSKKMELVYARELFLYFTKKILDCHVVSLQQFIPRNRSVIIYHLKKFKDNYNYNPDFRKLADKVEYETQKHHIA
jgi:chromosomal replication initiator protein